jgi:hypothetical protein
MPKDHQTVGIAKTWRQQTTPVPWQATVNGQQAAAEQRQVDKEVRRTADWLCTADAELYEGVRRWAMMQEEWRQGQEAQRQIVARMRQQAAQQRYNAEQLHKTAESLCQTAKTLCQRIETLCQRARNCVQQ